MHLSKIPAWLLSILIIFAIIMFIIIGSIIASIIGEALFIGTITLVVIWFFFYLLISMGDIGSGRTR